MSRRAPLLAAVALGAPGLAHAQESPRFKVDVTALGGYSSNPFSEAGDAVDSAYVALDIAPQLTLERERSTFRLSGLAHVQQYFRRYPTADSYRVSLDYRGRPAERLTTFARVDLSSAILGSDEGFGYLGTPLPGDGTLPGPDGGETGGTGTGTGGTGTVGGAIPVPSTGPLFTDIGLFGTRDRRRSVYATAGGAYAVSDRDSVTLSGFGEFARYRVFGDRSNYDAFGGSLGYNRRVSAYVNLGVRGSASRYDYVGTLGDSAAYSIEATGNARLNSRWTLDGALGVSFLDGAGLGSGTLTSLSGSLSLCSQGQRSAFCLQAARQARATGFNGAQYVTTVGADWTYRLDERSRVNLDASYFQEGGPNRLLNGANKYLRVAATYDRQLRERLRALASVRYREVFGGPLDRTGDYGGQVGLTYTFGDPR